MHTSYGKKITDFIVGTKSGYKKNNRAVSKKKK
ncbi:unnamed protein product [Acanthoscelides obtectus]|uniref:Uncharacterized protein n=1 Tax=Acanthoscelides obtectus TaxID=200917 RepID=A0A9P0KCW4_ACAOB|nr:unnamed protein product [Acanthoscelides obtectus]CAK1680143.1 hypothetical protein AOBTE_LOCUS32518 [Acanthoscelides obtectus]